MSIKVSNLCIYFVLIYLFAVSGLSNIMLFFIVFSGNICFFYRYFKNLGSAWIVTLIIHTIISTSLFLSVDLTSYMHININIYIIFLLELVVYIFLVGMFYLIDKKYQLLHSLFILKKKQYFLIAAYTTISLIIDYMLDYFLNREDSFFFYIDFIFVVFSIFLLFYVIYSVCLEYRFRKILSNVQTFIQKENYYKELDGFRHDFKSLLFSLSATIEDKDISATKTILDDMENYSNKIVDYDQLLNIDNKMIRGLLKELQNEANKKNVSLKITIPTTVNFFNINTFDLVRLLSIIVNNAIEESEEEHGEVSLTILKENKKHTKIVCKNRIKKNKVIDFNNLVKKNYTTKNSHNGLGLWNFKKISSQYKNLVYKFTLNKDKGEFIVIINIFD
ncbi:GHKL domain-containing protein [Enterococcus faecium]|uniref:GHKL domain-containing protein n=1 Tax=Enterococcus faecium TaxID=1352 RepID=UPI00189CBEC0|nr:GHKL domain-containing protein [Enterococcus faecium]